MFATLATFARVRDGKNRKWLVPFGPAFTHDSQHHGNPNAQGECEDDEIPEGGESQNKNQGAARGEQKPHKSAAAP